MINEKHPNHLFSSLSLLSSSAKLEYIPRAKSQDATTSHQPGAGSDYCTLIFSMAWKQNIWLDFSRGMTHNEVVLLYNDMIVSSSKLSLHYSIE